MRHLDDDVEGDALFRMQAESILGRNAKHTMHLCLADPLAAALLPATALRNVGRLLPDWQIDICRKALVHLLDDLLEVGVPIVLLDALEDLRDEEKVANESRCRQEKRVFRHVVAQASHDLLVEADHMCVRLQLLDVAVVVAAATASVGLVV